MPAPPPSAPEAESLERCPIPSSHAICVYAEPLVVGRRVVVVGDARQGLGERLLDLGARAVHVYDLGGEDSEDGFGAGVRGLVVRPLPAGAFDVRDGAFDVAIVPDLGLVPSERENLLQRLRRVLARQGVALIGARASAAPAGKSIDYYELYDLVSLQFPSVRMIAQVPFRGVALADLGVEEGAPEVSVDTQLAGEAEAPECFFALASQEDVRLAEYAIVQLPDAPDDRADRLEASQSERAVLVQAQLRATLLEAQVEELRSKIARQTDGSDHARRAGELEARLAEANVRLRDAEATAADRGSRAERFAQEAREAGAELSREQDRATALEGALVGAEGAVIALRERLADAGERMVQRDAELQAVTVELERLRGDVGAGEEQLARAALVEARVVALDLELTSAAEEHVAELAELERALQERARAVLTLEHEVSRREGLVRELLGSLDEARSAPGATAEGADPGMPASLARDFELAQMDLLSARRDLEARDASVSAAEARAAALAATNDELRGRLDALAMELARRESEKQEIVWRVAELEHQLSRLEAEQTELTVTLRPPPMGPPPMGPPPMGPPPMGPSAASLGASGAGGGASMGPGNRPRIEGAAVAISAAAQGDWGVEAERVAELQAEIDVLRQAMAQEHEARMHAESGDELTKARAELARQAVLLEQLSRELDARDRARTTESKGRASSEA